MIITILGAGNSGLAMAAHLKNEGYKINLWNRSKSNIERLIVTRTIVVTGWLNCTVKLDLVTSDLDLALSGTDLVLITTPANSHKELAYNIRNKIDGIKAIILNPGRTLGAYEFHKAFEEVNPYYHTILAETQSIIYTCRKIKEDEVSIITVKQDVALACLHNSDMETLWELIPQSIKRFYIPVKSMVLTSLANVGMILHCAPLLLNTGWTEKVSSGYSYYYEGISPTIASFIDRLDLERLKVAKALGYPIESTKSWMKRTYNLECETLYECVQNNVSYQTIEAPKTLNHRYIIEDVTTGLVPLESLGLAMGVCTPLTSLIIDLASNLMEVNFRELGRTYSNEDVQEIIEILKNK